MSNLKTVAILLLFLAPLYLWSTYESFFEERPGYIYDPNSDQLYWLTLSPHIWRDPHWKRHLLPFSSFKFTEISAVERQASLTKELAKKKKFSDLLKLEPEAILRDMAREFEQLKEQPLEVIDIMEMEIVRAEFFPRWDLDPKTMLPAAWRRLPEELGELKGAVIPADVVIARTYLNSRDPVDLQILRGVLFLTDTAAYTVNSCCLDFTDCQWKECTEQH